VAGEGIADIAVIADNADIGKPVAADFC